MNASGFQVPPNDIRSFNLRSPPFSLAAISGARAWWGCRAPPRASQKSHSHRLPTVSQRAFSIAYQSSTFRIKKNLANSVPLLEGKTQLIWACWAGEGCQGFADSGLGGFSSLALTPSELQEFLTFPFLSAGRIFFHLLMYLIP